MAKDRSEEPLVTCFISVRNGLPHLKSALESVRAQSYSNWEVVVVDDGSTDGTDRYLADFAASDERFLFIPTEGVGRGHALNRALARARGDFVTNLDADDALHPRRFETQIDIMQRENIDFLATTVVQVRDDAEPVWEPIDFSALQVRDVSDSLKVYNPICHSSVMMRRLVKGGPVRYDTNRTSQFDYELWCRLLREGTPIRKLEAPLTAKRIHSAQSFDNKRKLANAYASFRLQNQVISDHGGGLRLRAMALGRMAYRILPHRFRTGLHRRIASYVVNP